ncbi:hypothetical protein BRAS3809_2060007 [Bradyrhizobium sp. STM 3809]|nr:hypothetical protein BRAS3809_2060007 [Bradyrhizobium sp. STM 3809]
MPASGHRSPGNQGHFRDRSCYGEPEPAPRVSYSATISRDKVRRNRIACHVSFNPFRVGRCI